MAFSASPAQGSAFKCYTAWCWGLAPFGIVPQAVVFIGLAIWNALFSGADLFVLIWAKHTPIDWAKKKGGGADWPWCCSHLSGFSRSNGLNFLDLPPLFVSKINSDRGMCACYKKNLEKFLGSTAARIFQLMAILTEGFWTLDTLTGIWTPKCEWRKGIQVKGFMKGC